MKFKIFATICIILTVILTCHKRDVQNDELVFWTLQLGTFDKYINSVISDFEKQNPDVKIKWVDVPYSEGEKRTLAALLSDNPPDLINLTPDFSAMAAQKNALFEIPQDVMDNFPESLYQSLSYNGKFFAIPFYLTSAITFANKDLMAKASIIRVPKTYDEMFAYAKAARKAGVYIEMPAVNENDTFLKILNKYNVNVYENINSDISHKIFDMYSNLYKNDLIPKESITQSHREALEKYMAGQIIFLQAGANFLNIVKENAPSIYENTVLANQMTGTTNKYDFSLMNLIIPSKAKHREDALKFAAFLTNEQNQLEFAKLTSVLPANKYALEDSYFKQTNTKEDIARKLSAEQIKNVTSGIQNKRNKKNIILLVNSCLARSMTDKTNFDDDLEQLQNKIEDFNE